MTARWASISDDGIYRYELGRRWDDGALLPWVMLNPSTADAFEDDPTIRRCVGFAKAWGYGGILVGNVYALRATDPRELDRAADCLGPDNDDYLATMGREPLVVCAWGARVPLWMAQRTSNILTKHGAALRCLGRTKAGAPRHPLYVAAVTPLEEFAP